MWRGVPRSLDHFDHAKIEMYKFRGCSPVTPALHPGSEILSPKKPGTLQANGTLLWATRNSMKKSASVKKGGKDEVVVETGAVPTEAFEQGNTWSAKVQRLAGKFKIEQRGIERVPEKRKDGYEWGGQRRHDGM